MRLERTIIGMVHLPPLPGSPRWDGAMARVVASALADARALIEGGVDALLVENFGDAPFTPSRVEPATVAAMSVVAAEVRRALPGVRVVRGRPPARATPLGGVSRGRRAVPAVPLRVGRGGPAETAAELLSVADGLIVGTSVKRHGDVEQPVDRARVEKLVAAARHR